MNKFKLFITTDNQPNNIDKKLSSKIKKFSSERNLFFAGIYSNNHAGGTPAPLPAEKAPSKLEKTKTFCKNGLLKKCKSLKDLYQQHNQRTVNPEEKNDNMRSTFKNLDDFERNYLSSGKRDLVNELKKNFENQQKNENNAQKPPLAPSSAKRKESVKSLREKRSPEFAINSSVESQRGCVTRHSFYTSSPMVTTMQPTTQPHSISYSNTDFMSISEYELIESFERKPGWSQSALNLSTVTSLGAPPTPIPARLNAKNTETVNETIATPIDSDYVNCTNDNDVVDDFIKQRRCSISDYNANNTNNTMSTNNRLMNGDTMSLCELNLYPIYMQNICDTRSSGKFNTNNSSSGYGSSSISSDLNYSCGGKLKKYSSVNQIDLNVLKNELNDFVDMQWTTTSFSRNCGIQRSMPMVATRRKVCLYAMILCS